ncbi:Uncharacterized protein HZ326_9219 [Fusarium oxysporum f. sp. albedinis]|nr:Uncharacterized protein HZ326_9219 [Fusarium oxysporum f. sp. albedinis]
MEGDALDSLSRSVSSRDLVRFANESKSIGSLSPSGQPVFGDFGYFFDIRCFLIPYHRANIISIAIRP